jgi:hypothetical protein
MALAALLLPCPPARAHATNVATADVSIGDDAVQIWLSVNLLELDLLLGLDRDRNGAVDQAELDAARDRMAEYLRQRVAVASGGIDLPFEARRFRVGRNADDRPVALLDLRFPRAGYRGDLVIRCEPLSEMGPDHRTLASVSRGNRLEQFVFQRGAPYRAEGSAGWAHVAQFLGLGILHIFTGYDHIFFLVGLLLAVGGMADVLKIVTSFTVAHSLTMSLAVLGLVQVPSRLVETGIAVSVAYVAIENLLRRGARRRWLVSLGFGLVHGFGFANVLAEMHLPRASLASSLVAFNTGVEIGQLAIVLAVLPALRLLRRTAAYAPVMSCTSALLLTVGLFWAWHRAF